MSVGTYEQNNEGIHNILEFCVVPVVCLVNFSLYMFLTVRCLITVMLMPPHTCILIGVWSLIRFKLV